ncbi:efflux RND transporter periplasmic adaptor subunit [Leadbetterella sp. DM7]|uniref:efflux RND transporter periplasmic adaptor subunit n=1 Tax=Leadbetterella sp. DM7 TaxID=3235085 RepID=UPI00349ED965
MSKRNLILMSVSFVWLSTSCKPQKEAREEEKEFLVTTPAIADTTLTKDYVCQIRSINHIELRAQEKGYLQKIYVDEGQHVTKGQLLFKIMPNLYEAEVEKAQAEAEYADIELKNTKTLVETDVVSPNELAMAKAKYNKAKADLDLMKTHLAFTEIRAPFDGILNSFKVRLGSYVEEGELLTELSDNSKMWVYFNVPETEYLTFMDKSNKGILSHVDLRMANGDLFDHTGVVETIEADFDNETGNIPFRATFPNPKGLLRFGQTGSIVITTPVHNALLIPQKATFEVLDKRYVFVVGSDSKVHAREISVSAELPHLYAVATGLSKDDKILLEGVKMVRENEKIKFKTISPSQALSSLNLYAE